MKRILLALLVVITGVGSVNAATETTVYYAVETDVVGSYTVKLNVHYGTGNDDGWATFEMTNTNKTYFGKYIYTCTFTDKYDGLARMQIQLYNGSDFVSQQQPIADSQGNDRWTVVGSYNGKMYEHNMGWRSYNYDKTVTIHAKKTTSWTPSNVHNYFNDGATGDVAEAVFPGNATTPSSLYTNWYDYTITGRPCTTVIVNNGNSGSGNQSGNVTIGDESEYWITYDGTTTTSVTTAPSDYSYTRAVTSGNYGTICLPFSGTVSGATLYTIDSKIEVGGVLKGINITEAGTSLTAGQGYIFKASGSELTVSSLTGNYTAATGGAIVGNYELSYNVTPGKYIIYQNKLCQAGSGVTIGQYKAYIDLDNVNNTAARGANSIFFDDATGIESVQNENSENVMFNLQGQRVTDAHKGLVIVGGKKMLRK